MSSPKRYLFVAFIVHFLLAGCYSISDDAVSETSYTPPPPVVKAAPKPAPKPVAVKAPSKPRNKAPKQGSDQWFQQMGTKRDTASYAATCEQWGRVLARWDTTHDGEINDRFLYFLLRGKLPDKDQVVDFSEKDVLLPVAESSYYFKIDPHQKRACRNGFHDGFGADFADAVFSTHVSRAASVLGHASAVSFRQDVEAYRNENMALLEDLKASIGAQIAQTINYHMEGELNRTIDDSVVLFKALIIEGSSNDRNIFKTEFISRYKALVENFIRSDGAYTGTEEVPLSLSYQLPENSPRSNQSMNHAVNLDSFPIHSIYRLFHSLSFSTNMAIVPAEQVWEYIYTQALIGVGAELGQGFGQELVSSQEVVDVLQSALAAVDSEHPKKNEIYLLQGFAKAYNQKNPDSGVRVFRSLIEEGGLSVGG